MPDIGLGELIVIAVLALLVFGDRLPKVAADAARTLRQVRQMATAARKDLADAAGLEKDPELASAVRDLRDLDPRRVLEPLDDDRAAGPGAGPGRSGAGQERGPASGAPPASGTAGGAPPAGGADGADVPPASPAPEAPAPGGRPAVDPDWT